MNAATIQRQYDEVIAPHYDQDPQLVLGASLDSAAGQLRKQQFFDNGEKPLKVLDVGVGTGLFLAKLKAAGGDQVQPFGLDLSEKMVDTARKRIPDLVAEVDDAANLDAHFPDQSFDLICTHFITGFVPMQTLAPKIWDRLKQGGYWQWTGSCSTPDRRSRAMRERLSQGRPEKPLLLTVSRLAPEKNVGFLADVIREVSEAYLAVVGDGPHRNDLERRFSGLDAHSLGYLKGEELAAAYASADAFVYASETETMGNVVLGECGCTILRDGALRRSPWLRMAAGGTWIAARKL